MPWERTTVTEAKLAFVKAYRQRVQTKEISMRGLCEEFGISRKSGYKLVRRCDELGLIEGLRERSRAPHGGRHWVEAEIVSAVLETRMEFPDWGSRKIVAYLQMNAPEVRWPAASVAHDWIKRAGLVEPAQRVRRYRHPGPPPAVAIERPNQQWSVDFKGHFRTQDRRYCYPLTVADSFSRYVLGCDALEATSFELVWRVFDRLFREYGLPETILSDNGSPFSSTSVRRLSKLAVRWMRLGIRPVLIEPGKPQQNGRHERMHRSLKELACQTPSANCSAQQRQFDRFLQVFNHVRPHEALGQTPPTHTYTPSPRRYPRRLPEIVYPSEFHVRRVRSSGEIRWQGQWLFVSEALIGEPVAFALIDNGCWLLRYADLDLGYYSERDKKLYLDKTRPDGKAENGSPFSAFPQVPQPTEVLPMSPDQSVTDVPGCTPKAG